MTIFKAVFQQPVRGNMSHIASKTFLPMRLSDVLSVALVACLLFAYVLSYYPFIFQAYIPRVLRISIEGATLLLLLLVNSTYTYHKGLIWYLIFISISIITILLGLDLLTNVIFSYNKMMFFVLAIGLFCGNRKALDVCIKLWLRLWFLFCVMAILAFVGHNSGILNFLPLDFRVPDRGSVNPSPLGDGSVSC